jgi:hypothetical protein
MKNSTEIKIPVSYEMSSEKAKVALMNAVYTTAVVFYESLGEYRGLTDGKKIQGNGHHMAQSLAKKAGDLWDERLVDKK